MHIRRHPVAIAFIVFLTAAAIMTASAEETESEDVDSGLIVLPSLGYSPENGFILGGALQRYSVPYAGAPTDSVGLSVIYGTEGVFRGSATTDYRFGRDGALLETDMGLARSSEEFAGIGRLPVLEDQPEEFEVFEIDVSASLLFPLSTTVSVGPTAGIAYIDVRQVEDGGRLDSEQISGSDGAVLSGIGGRVRYDTRDSNVYATEGFYADWSVRGFMPEWGSSTRFGSTKLDVRSFFSPAEGLVIAGQTTLESVVGAVPFQGLPTFGGANIVRGIRSGRYRDKHALTSQFELRTPRVWRFSGVVFAGAGTVADTPGNIFSDYPVIAGGAGVRFAVDPEQNQNIRFDLAWNGNEISPYINFGEAF